MFNCGPITDAVNEAVIAEILVEDGRGVFRGQVGQDDIYDDDDIRPWLRI